MRTFEIRRLYKCWAHQEEILTHLTGIIDSYLLTYRNIDLYNVLDSLSQKAHGLRLKLFIIQPTLKRTYEYCLLDLIDIVEDIQKLRQTLENISLKDAFGHTVHLVTKIFIISENE